MKEVLYPNVWGRGQLFSYSGLEGECTMFGTLTGQLLQDNLGMRLDYGLADFYLVPRTSVCNFSIVSSDLIEGILGRQPKPFAFLALNQSTIVGYAPKEFASWAFHADKAEREIPVEGGKAFGYANQAYCCLAEERGEEFAFSFARRATFEEAYADAKAGLLADVRAIAPVRRAYFERVPRIDWLTEDQQRTLAKAFSVMKNQVNSPEGVLKCRYTTPDRIPHKKMWLWDSAYHSMGNVYLEPELAFETIRAVLYGQREDGMIFHSQTPEGGNIDRTQPPILAWAFWKLYNKTGRLDWVEEAFPILERYLDWNFKNRDEDQNLLLEWFTDPDQPDCRCGESGMDNTPRFDTDTKWDAIDFSCFMANEMRCMSALATLLNKPEEAAKYAEIYQKMGDKINDHLYCEKDGRYYDRALGGGEFNDIPTVSCFLPLFAGICPPERAKKLAEDLSNPETFGLPYMVPTVAKNHETFSIDYWRGTTWISYNYLIEQGLRENGYTELADRIVDATIKMVTEWYMRDGTIYEVYDPRALVSPTELWRKGPPVNPSYAVARLQIVRDFGWSSTLFTAMIMERDERLKK